MLGVSGMWLVRPVRPMRLTAGPRLEALRFLAATPFN